METAIRRSTISTLLSVVALLLVPPLAAEDPKAAPESGFSGRWALLETKDNVVLKSKSGGWSILGGTDEGAGGSGVPRSGGGFDIPLEVMTDARRLVIVEEGATVRVTYPTGRKRTFVTDGVKRYLDDGDGPADVTVRRKGTTVTVASEWFRGYKLKETWELQASPRRLVVTGKLKGRESQQYVRTFVPAPPEDASVPAGTAGSAAASSTSVSGEAAGPASPAAAIEAKPPAVDRLADCSVHPPRRASAEELSRLVRVPQDEARNTAIASLAPLKAGDVITSEVEAYEGCLVWPFTMRLPSRKGVQEVFVDAGDGKVVWSEFVPMGPSSQGEAPAP